MRILQKFKKLSVWGQLGVVGSIASIIALLYSFFVPVGSNTVNNTKTNNSGIIIEGNVSGGNVAGHDIINNQYGVPQKVVDRLEELLKEKDIRLQEREAVTASWIKKYKDLETQLASRTDDTAKQVKVFLNEGKLEDAEKLFLKALEDELNNAKKATTQAAVDAYSLANIKALQLNYPAAEAYYRQAVKLDPDNSVYLNALGVHLYKLGKYAEAEPLYRYDLFPHLENPDTPHLAKPEKQAELYYNIKALDYIVTFSDQICSKIQHREWNSKTKVEADAWIKADLTKFIKKLPSIGVKLGGNYDAEEYSGVLRQDLAGVLINEKNCKQNVTKMLIDKLIQ